MRLVAKTSSQTCSNILQVLDRLGTSPKDLEFLDYP